MSLQASLFGLFRLQAGLGRLDLNLKRLNHLTHLAFFPAAVDNFRLQPILGGLKLTDARFKRKARFLVGFEGLLTLLSAASGIIAALMLGVPGGPRISATVTWTPLLMLYVSNDRVGVSSTATIPRAMSSA